MRYILSGGGTGGSVSPLIAIYQQLQQKDHTASFLFIGTRHGPEKELTAKYGIPFKRIFAGKFRRYFSFKNVIDPLWIALGFIQSFFIIVRFKPDVVLSAGGFVSVPLAWAAKLLGKKVVIHQQDIAPGLANKFMAPAATLITVSFPKSLGDFPEGKAVYVGNPIRSDLRALPQMSAARAQLGMTTEKPTVLIMGGGTGALKLNQWTIDSLARLLEFCNVIHLTGGKVAKPPQATGYLSLNFSTDMATLYAAADLVVCRAGMSTLTELSALGKASLLIPMPKTHQEFNAMEFYRQNAAVALEQNTLNAESFADAIHSLLSDESKRMLISANVQKIMPRDAAEKIATLIYELF